jgi:uncharacterized small protein (TIGR04563 family)
MPYYMQMSRIDCHYEQASPELRAILPDVNHRLSSRNHTSQTFEEELRKLASERHDLVIDALVDDGFRGYRLYRARAGHVSAIEVDERPEGALDSQVELPLDDLATVTLVRNLEEIRTILAEQSDFDGDEGDEVTIPLRYEDEASMRNVLDLVSKGIDEGEHRFVAEAEFERFLVELRPCTASVRKLAVVTEPQLFARLLRGQFASVPEPPPRADEKKQQALYWPQDMLQSIKEEAFRLDTSVSNIVQKAWKASRVRIAETELESLSTLLDGFSGDKAKQTIFFPADMLVEIRDQAARLDESLSFVVQGAWVLARDAIAALPAPQDS